MGPTSSGEGLQPETVRSANSMDAVLASNGDSNGGQSVGAGGTLAQEPEGAILGAWDASKGGILSGALLIAAGLIFPFVVDDPVILRTGVNAILLAMIALPVGFMMDRTGMISLGHAGFFGVAGYGLGILTTHYAWHPVNAAIVAFVAGTVVALLVGAIVVRTPGISFVVITLAAGQAMFVLASLRVARPLTGGYDGLVINFEQPFLGFTPAQLAEPATFWLLGWTVLVVFGLILWLVARSHFGQVLVAIRENEERARFCGIRTFGPRVAIFGLTGAMASFGGALAGLHRGFISPDVLHWATSAEALFAAIIGGVVLVTGPVVGVFFLVFAQDRFAAGGNIQLFTGLMLVLVLVFAPEGLTGLAAKWTARLRARLRRGTAHGTASNE